MIIAEVRGLLLRAARRPTASSVGERGLHGMPIYEYVCVDCERRFEKYVSTWGQAVQCPACGSGEVQKQVSSFAFSAAGGTSSSTASGCGCGRGSCGCHH